MTLFILAYAAGVLTIASPCIFPILPFVLSRADKPFRQGALPMLLGLAAAFAAVASLAAVAGNWAVGANTHGRTIALVLMTLFGLTMLLPGLAARVMAPVVSIGSSLSGWAERRGQGRDATAGWSVLLGVATGLVWAPCAGPVLGLILTGAALQGPSVRTSLLLLTYGLGAATSLAVGLLAGRRLFVAVRRRVRWGDGFRRILGAAVIAGAVTIWGGFDTSLLASWSSTGTQALEQGLITALRHRPTLSLLVSPAHAAPTYAAPAAEIPAPLNSVLGAKQWLNTKKLRTADLRDKVVLVNFWTYSCINCLRALPHVRAWAAKYKDKGLVVIGVHTPEFAFEKNLTNVNKAVASLGVSYPVAMENDFGIWRAFDNQAWPAFYIAGADGRVRRQVFGERDYDKTERLIQKLLSEATGAQMAGGIVTDAGQGAQAAADMRDQRSVETYIGYAQAQNFAPFGGMRPDAPVQYRTPTDLPLNNWGLSGVWAVGREFATLGDAPGGITYRFHARDLHLVLAPPPNGRAVRFRVRIDGVAPGADHGSDVDAGGWGSVTDSRLYQLVRQAGPVKDRTFEIEFLDPGVRAYVFTFG